MKKFNELTGFKCNPYVKEDHVFIAGLGCFYETAELARLNNKKTGNEVGLYIETANHDGVSVYRELQENIFD